jgi:hypothetical protein
MEALLFRLTTRARHVLLGAALTGVLLVARVAPAQVTPAAGYTPPDDTPSITIGAVIFADYTYTDSPKATDADGNSYNPSAFNVSRAYINITGNVTHNLAFRVTPDITRETFAGPAVSGSLVYRIKYAFAQYSLDDRMTKGSWVRLGIQQTPYVDLIEGIYRYRFQSTVFVEREGFLTSSDAGVSFHTNFAKNYGDVHVGVYNGEGYSKPEGNNQPAFQVRGTFRPFATRAPLLRGLRLTGFYDADNYMKNDPRKRGVFAVTFEHKYVNAAYEYLHSDDQVSKSVNKVKGDGYSFWFTPRSSIGLEGLFRYDHYAPDNSIGNRERSRTIVGVAYWFKHQRTPTTAIMLDYDGAGFDNFTPPLPDQRKIAVHALVNF